MTSKPVELPRRATALRLVHTGVAVAELAALGHVWRCALTGRRDRWLGVSVGALAAEGGALVIGRGNCPLGPLQRRWGDPVPLFELVLPPWAARAALPVLIAVAVAGVAAVAVRSEVTPPTEDQLPRGVRGVNRNGRRPSDDRGQPMTYVPNSRRELRMTRSGQSRAWNAS